MTTVTPEEIAKWRSQLQEAYPQALPDLDVIEQCGGNLERAAHRLARRNLTSEESFVSLWLEALHLSREIVEKEFKDESLPELIKVIKIRMSSGKNSDLIEIAIPVSLYIAYLVKIFSSPSPLKADEGKKSNFLRLDWAGSLKDLRDEYTSLELQKKALEWRDAD